ncbi:MAG: bifunctional diaminohydroxyphosphoribosylaminopyrimidine deaminase/5-amino-6-(5-phosphoribosylamino)uracil reductase RibD [Thermodesulfovibrionales bacterium]|jgi:diaminohydroxyphosphoribosylaminopyrimidine deaminase/5-amino-6-(5-phosphoribosylamino)uracil reductase|nr:bifunctional diaminohydroxyphosphoribosylaminopyrimidine deaminase/5-amino-6-(5-phosphoribosylamino)uracil reductase RibD [Thermodesulfovibrionales bacterium]
MEGVRILDKDKKFMQRALNLAEKARGMTSPNPMVGAVIVRNGKIIAEDYHKKAGEPHAEALAIIKAGDKTKGSILYVTLEPCCHLDKRTPPCTKAIINSGIKKVFIAMKDPNPKVSGKGIEELRKHEIEVVSGMLEDKAKKLNEAYIKYITTRIPFVVLKAAMTLDGKIATPEGQSKWITGEMARKIVHRMRGSVDAILTAVGTVKADNPELTVRLGAKKGKRQKVKNPIRIVIDPNLEIPLNYKIFNVPPETIVVTRRQKTEARSQKLKTLTDKGVKFIEYDGERVDLKWLIKRLGETGITSVMIEGGSSLNAYALQDGIVDKVVFFIAPKIIGGKDSIPAIGGKTFRRLEDAFRVHDMKIKRVSDDLMIEGYIAHGS